MKFTLNSWEIVLEVGIIKDDYTVMFVQENDYEL